MSYFNRVILASIISTMFFYGNQNLPADVVWDESVDGDLSNDPSSPTVVSFSNGFNTVIGSLSEPDGDTRDYLTFTLGPNQFLTGMILDTFEPDGISFHGINAGSTSFIPMEETAGNFLGLEFVDHNMVGTDMLPGLAEGNWGSIGFTIPLGPGDYTYLIQELSFEEFRSYQITFIVVPEPSAIGIYALAGLFLAVKRNRRG